MPILFDCTCGKRLKARDEIVGKDVRCPQCGNMLAVPGSTGATEPDSDNPFFVETTESEDDPSTATSPAVSARRDDALAFPWLKTDQENSALVVKEKRTIPTERFDPALAKLIGSAGAPPADVSPRVASPELARLIEAPAATLTEGSPPQPDKQEPTPEPLVRPELESIRHLRSPAVVQVGRAHALPRGMREPWFVTWAEGLARFVCSAALILVVLVPAAFLVGGLVSLARSGDPKGVFQVRIAGLQAFAVLLIIAIVNLILAITWAAPILVMVDLWRRYRALGGKLERVVERLQSSEIEEEPNENEASSEDRPL